MTEETFFIECMHRSAEVTEEFVVPVTYSKLHNDKQHVKSQSRVYVPSVMEGLDSVLNSS